MIFKVLYQPSKDQAIVREGTKTLYVEEESERAVRKKLAKHHYNIEYVQALSPEHLAYEQQSSKFKVESL
ncbi:DNA-dependent RNA polymerase auxiliary subunit epsilon family protein [Bacillaceae bacterium SIJ1]|uniref:DNA-dependent RNA polymerase subunit epsilon n=1 Tax=Litoribacterium kuwaitense TaxID=1398745 RepID=UPI0013EAD204|nr:DNA-directed RNA polymerase subunit epsilon [Litoribacterium kuwaitense]NGP44404.1 DNA-dependent RNA polymerase auxiliary subunit epsilon family protein [Litoribacterium kuwaitense]